MIIVDDALRSREAEGKPIRVGLIGAGFMARGLTNQIINSVKGMRLMAIYNRRVEKAISAFQYANETLEPVVAESQDVFEDALRREAPVVTENVMLLARSPHWLKQRVRSSLGHK